VLVVQKASHRQKSNRKDNNTNGRVVVEEEDAVVVVMRVVCCLGKEKVRPQFRVLLQRIIQQQSSARTADLLLRRCFACATASCPRGNRSSFSARRERCACLSVARRRGGVDEGGTRTAW